MLRKLSECFRPKPRPEMSHMQVEQRKEDPQAAEKASIRVEHQEIETYSLQEEIILGNANINNTSDTEARGADSSKLSPVENQSITTSMPNVDKPKSPEGLIIIYFVILIPEIRSILIQKLAPHNASIQKIKTWFTNPQDQEKMVDILPQVTFNPIFDHNPFSLAYIQNRQFMGFKKGILSRSRYSMGWIHVCYFTLLFNL
jgi:hypothetical protein